MGQLTKKIGEYKPVLVKDAETNNITVKFQQVPPEHIRERNLLPSRGKCSDPTKQIKIKKQKPRKKKRSRIRNQHQRIAANKEQPKFGPRPDTSSADFDFKSEARSLTLHY